VNEVCSGGSRGGRRSEISLWKKKWKAREGRGVIFTRRGTVRCLRPHPPLDCFQYVPLNCTSGSVSGAKPSKITCRLSITREGEGAGAMMSGPLISGSNQAATPLQFPFIVLHGRGAFFNLNPRRLLQLQSSLLTSSLVTNFNPRHLRLQPSSPSTLTLVTFQFPKPCRFLFPLLLDGRGVLDAAATR
jgi:hypothetical protein